MKSRYIYFTLFVGVALIQLFIPFQMIQHHEDILNTGKEYKFRIRPVDPSDILRGKFLALNFKDSEISVSGDDFCSRGETVYVQIENDREGYAIIRSITLQEPQDKRNFIKAKTGYCNYDSINSVNIDFPFDRFYLEETKAAAADSIYNKTTRSNSSETYALVRVKNGEAVLQDVRVGNNSILQLIPKK